MSAAPGTSTPPRSARAPRRIARAVQKKVPLDAFGDAGPVSSSTKRSAQQKTQKQPKQPKQPRAVVVLGAVAIVVGCVAGVFHVSIVAGVFATAVAAGAWLSGRTLSKFLPFLALVAGAATAAALSSPGAGIAGVDFADQLATLAAPVLFAACCTLGFGMLPRSMVFLAVSGARRSEQARADAEVLKLIDDARLFRRLGRTRNDDDNDNDEAIADVGLAVAQRDRLYRLLRLAERGIKNTAVVAVYVVDDAATSLVLCEQLVSVDAANVERLPLGGRGVGAAGLVGLCFTRRAPLRVVDGGETGAALKAHRKSGPPPASVLCVPLLARGGACRGVVVVDRSDAVPFGTDDEAFAHALGAEFLEGLAGEEIVDDLEADRRRTARVYAAARALAGVTRTADVVEVAADAFAGLCASVAVVDLISKDADKDGKTDARVLAATGLLAPLTAGAVAADSFAARAVAEQTTLPHTSLAKAQPRPILFQGDGVDTGGLVDVRVVPLVSAGEARGVVVVATNDKFGAGVVDAVKAVADVVALALASARAFDAVEKQATTDGLTGVANRRALDRRLDEAVARAKRSNQPLCVLLTDVDHFKSVNDAWGHATGDEVLKGVAKSLEEQARGTDVVGRLGGEEFVVVCEATDLQGALTGAERMRLAIKALSFETAKGPLSVTSSFGVALWMPGESGHDVLERADQQLYKAKSRGRDRVVGE